jgi:hypothetical protein
MKLYQYKFIAPYNNQSNYRIIRVKYISSIFVCFIFFLSYYLYYLALEKCMEGQFKCGIKIKWIHKKLVEAILSSIIIAILIELMLLKLLTKLHLIHVFIVQSSFFIYSHGQEFYDHGLFNFLGNIIIIITIDIMLLPFNFFLYLIKKKKKALLIYFSFLIFVFVFYFYFIHSKINCTDWRKGLNNTYIENDIKKFGCQIRFPKICPYKIGTYFLDVTKIYNIKCGRDLEGKELTLKFSDSPYINKNTTRFGYPLTNKDPMCLNEPRKNSTIKFYVKKNLLDMDNKKLFNNEKNIPEIIADFSKNKYGKLIINVNYNDTLSKERKKLDKNSKPYIENILILYFD